MWPWVTVVECLQLAIVRKIFCSAQACCRDHLDKQRVSASLIPSPSNPSQRMHKTKSISNCSGECLDRSEGEDCCGDGRDGAQSNASSFGRTGSDVLLS